MSTTSPPPRRLVVQHGRVGEALDDALAVLVAGAGVAEGEGPRHVADGAIGFVNDESWTVSPDPERRTNLVDQCTVAVDRLFDDQHARPQRAQRRPGERGFPVRAKRLEVPEVLVAVECHQPVGARLAVEQRDDPLQAWQVDVALSGELDLEIAQAVGTDRRLEVLRQPIVHPFFRSDVGGRQRIAKTYRVSHGARAERLPGQRLADRGCSQLGIDRAEVQGEAVAAQQAMQRLAERAAQGIEHCALDQADAKVREQRGHPARRGPRRLLPIELAPEIEERDRLACNGDSDGRGMPDRRQHLRQILLEGRRWILREPLRRKAFGGQACLTASVGENLRPDEDLRHVRHARDAVAEGKAGARRQHEQVERCQRELHGSHRPRKRSRPATSAAILRSATERLSIQKPQSGCT